MYDDFSTRDSNGDLLGSHPYPHFSSRRSKKAILSGDAIPVKSCWNGVGMIQPKSLVGIAAIISKAGAFDDQPFQSPSNPLRFRSVPDSSAEYHLEKKDRKLVHFLIRRSLK